MSSSPTQKQPEQNPQQLIAELRGLLYTSTDAILPADLDQTVRQNFKLFDRDNDGYLNMKEVQTLLISVDISLDDGDIKLLYEALNEGDRGISEEDFFLFIMKKFRDENKEAQLIIYFKEIDKEGTGTIKDLDTFKDLLMSKGLRMSEAQADEFLEVINPKLENEFAYGEFCKLIAEKEPGKKGKKKKGKKGSKGKK